MNNEYSIKRWISLGMSNVGCNLNCDYCYLKHHAYTKNDGCYKYPIDHMIKALTQKRLGGITMFNVCADGETLLIPEIDRFVKGLLENGHYVSIVSNCTLTSIIKKFVEIPQELKKRLVFKCSLHYKELKKYGWLDLFANNIKLLRKSGVSITIECVACDEMIEFIDEIILYSRENFGALPHILTGRSEKIEHVYSRFNSKLSDTEYFDTWKIFDSDLFFYQYKDFDKNCQKFFCHAGEYTGIVNLEYGDLYPCPGNRNKVINIFENLYEPIVFTPIAKSCPLQSCFMGHVLNGLGGDYVDDYDAGYRFWQFRDRICADGGHWLTPEIKEVYSHLCSESNRKFSIAEKEFYISLMNRVNGKKDMSSNCMEKIAKTINESMKKNGIQFVAIYGLGNLGDWITTLLSYTDIKIICGIDKREIKKDYNYPVYKLADITTLDCDAIIITPYYEYAAISIELKNRIPGIKAISLSNIVNL